MVINVILADDHAVVRDGVKAVIERKGKDIKIIGEASNGMVFLLQTILACCSHSAAAWPDCSGSLLRRSTSIRWLSVPPETSRQPASVSSPARVLALSRTAWM